MISEQLFRRYYPDNNKDGTLAFYNWVRAAIDPKFVVLNLGAGPPTRNPIRILKGEVAKVIGADIDPIVLTNPEMDEACIIQNGRIPVPSSSCQLVLCDYVFEHISTPIPFLREAYRVLTPGGYLYFRTANKFHYVGLISSLTPHWFHELVANSARGLPIDTHLPWKTRYRMNTPKLLHKQAHESGFSRIQLRLYEAEPSYLVFGSIPFLLGVAYERLVARYDRLACFRASIFGRLTR